MYYLSTFCLNIEWRDNVHLSDPKKIRNAIEVAVRGLDTMKKYTSLNKRSSSWSITLEQDPLGIGKQQQEQEEQQRLAQQQQQQSITTSSTTTTTKLNNNKSEEFEILNNNVHKLE